MALHQFKMAAEQANQRLDVVLTHLLSDAPSRSFVQKLIEQGYVKVDEVLRKANYKVQENQEILVDVPKSFLTPDHIEPQDIDLDIFYEDQWLIVINKPIGMMVHPAIGRNTGTLVNALLHHRNELSDINSDVRPGIVHRLDEATSGLILVAKDNITHARLAKLFERRDITKQYVALVEGDLEFDEGVIDQPIGRNIHHREKMSVSYADGSRDAKTYYRALKRKNKISLVALFPKTGRTHQLRVHMKYLGHPILGDEKYGKKNNFDRLALHAQMLSFKHPHTKELVEFSTATPAEFLKVF